MVRRLIGFAGAIQFLTRVPIRLSAPVDHGRAVPWFPIVGACLGVVVGGLAAGLVEFVSPAVAAALAVIAGLAITGAFHEDGLADVADAFGGGWTREQRFEILKDSRHGTYGVAALTSSIVLRVVAVASIATPAAMFASLVAAHTLGRAAAVGVVATVPPATESGLGADAGRSLRSGPTIVSIAAAVAITAAATGWWVAPLSVVTALAAFVVVWLSIRKIGGIVGDALGAVEQVAECLVLVVASGLAARHDLWWS
jgi:adenosylcobinamide-GDP ribazoletransferase